MVTGVRFPTAVHLLVICTLLLGLYLLSMPRLITFEDAGLFQMVCHSNGIAHPPGYPLFTLVCSATSKIPYLDPVIWGNLLSAVFAVLAASIVFCIVQSITRELSAAYIAALGLGASATFWSQAIIIEVYSLNVFLFAILLLLALRYLESPRTSLLYWGAFVYGLALANHWPLIVLATPGLMAILWQAKDKLLSMLCVFRTWIVCCLALILGLLPYASIVLKRQPFISLYGPIDSFPEFVRYVARSAYGDGMGSADWTDKANYLVWLLGEAAKQFGWIGLAVIAIGVTVSVRSLPRWLGAGLWFIFLGGTLVLMLLVHFEYYYLHRAVFRAYPLISYLVMSVWLGIGFKALVGRIAISWQSLNPLLVKASVGTLLVLTIVAAGFQENYRATESLAEEFGRLVLGNLEEGSNLFVSGDNETGPIGYLHHVKGLRPDVTLYSRENVVFNNALARPLSKRDQQHARLREFIETADSVSYLLSPALNIQGIDYGLFIAHMPGQPKSDKQRYMFIEEVDIFLQKLLTAYEQNQITDPHSLSFAHIQLLRFSRQYVGYAFEHDTSVVPSDGFLTTLHRLQKTFPGRLVTLGYLLRHKQLSVSKLFLAELVVQGFKGIPEEVSLRNHSLFYEYSGHVALIDSPELAADKQLAISYFERSLELYPAPDNASICMLKDLYDPSAEQEKLATLEQKFDQVAVKCHQATP